ncbi:fungal specific transcription factor domain protein [Metarhizium robertsii]|uniref:Fungal specific transcription factor domain protein n=2 Tax=Metarhizium robertsii TaxID=568076 RepID=A0A0A1UWQ5_9HYPO|nr:fungal specific transcription factor domain protein [Metarhizium robertsii]
MDEYYHHFLTSMSGVGGYFPSNPEELSMSTMPGYHVPISGTMMQNPYHNLGHLGTYPDQSHLHASKTGKGCKKGNRDCVYPDPPASKSSKSKDNNTSQKTSPKSSNEGDDADMDRVTNSLQTILDEDEPEELSSEERSDSQLSGSKATGSSNRNVTTRQSTESLSPDGIKDSSPSVSTGGSSVTVAPSIDLNIPTDGRADWSHLPLDYQHYLNYFVENITSFHYSIMHDADDFFGTILPSLAVQHEPLLNAVVGFATYHATLQNPAGKLQDFLKYYNKSVTLLLESINRKEMNNILNLITILQLLTIEEYFGDWINLMGHQKAAFQVIRKIFTPDTVMHTPVGRACIDWYTRYDCYVAIMGGFPTDLPREWFNRMNEYNESQLGASPDEFRWKISSRSTQLRSISYDMSMLYARGSRGQIGPEDFTKEHKRITNELLEWKSTWDAALSVPEYLVTDFSYQRDVVPGDIVNPYMLGLLYEQPLFTNTLITTEWTSIMIMHLSQSSDIPAEQVFIEMAKHAYTICQYFETVEFWPLKPKGALIPLQPCISIAALFLPRDSRHQMWVRRKFALLDTMGFIHPTTRRIKMAHLFRDPSCAHWWLPNDEGLTPILQAIRTFADERNTAAVNAQQENIREVRHLFAKMEAAELALTAGNDVTGMS